MFFGVCFRSVSHGSLVSETTTVRQRLFLQLPMHRQTFHLLPFPSALASVKVEVRGGRTGRGGIKILELEVVRPKGVVDSKEEFEVNTRGHLLVNSLEGSGHGFAPLRGCAEKGPHKPSVGLAAKLDPTKAGRVAIVLKRSFGDDAKA